MKAVADIFLKNFVSPDTYVCISIFNLHKCLYVILTYNINTFLSKRCDWLNWLYPDKGHKLNVHKTSLTSSERLMYVQFTSCVQGLKTER